jgi:hypothetical protein
MDVDSVNWGLQTQDGIHRASPASDPDDVEMACYDLVNLQDLVLQDLANPSDLVKAQDLVNPALWPEETGAQLLRSG